MFFNIFYNHVFLPIHLLAYYFIVLIIRTIYVLIHLLYKFLPHHMNNITIKTNNIFTTTSKYYSIHQMTKYIIVVDNDITYLLIVYVCY